MVKISSESSLSIASLLFVIVCPILFEEVRVIKWNEMLVITVNRTVALIKCKHPEYNTEIKVQYQCNMQTKQWKLIYKNDNFTCRKSEKHGQNFFLFSSI